MREEIADLVYPVLTRGIRLKERLAADDGDLPSFSVAQKELLGLLQAASQAQRWTEFGGDKSSQDSIRARDQFLGIRYALVCWLDEIFILDSSWKDQWSERSLEVDLYKSRERAWKFWEQADHASARPSTDALEVFFLCVMLGFRGDKANTQDELRNWCERVKAQLEQGQGPEFTLPVEGQAGTDVPPLTGTRRQQSMLVALSVVALILVPIVAFLLALPRN